MLGELARASMPGWLEAGDSTGVTDRDDIRYIYSTFPIVERQERRAWGSYRSRDLCLALDERAGCRQARR